MKVAENEPQSQELQTQAGLPGFPDSGDWARNYRFGLSRKKLHEIKRFSLAGMINTPISASLIYLLQVVTANPYLANTLGYLIGGTWAYFLHAKFTFQTKAGGRSFSIFALVATSGYILNLIILQQGLRIAGPFMAQTAAIVSYAVYSYLMQSRFAFPTPISSSRY